MGVSEPTAGRLLLVSNRLPVTVRPGPSGVRVTASAGGLATGLREPHARSQGLWFGWPGDLRRLSPEQRAAVDERLARDRFVPIHLDSKEIDGYYHGFSNGVLWPLFHYLLDRIPLETRAWNEYRQVNERFADAVAAACSPGDRVWVHDFHLALVPALLRARVPDARIGFFLHTPFPTSEVFRTLPERAALLEGILGADLLGFHTATYLRHFTVSLLRILGIEAEVDRVWHGGREVRLAVHPMGIDFAAFDALAKNAAIRAEAATTAAAGQRILLGVDRLDYTKGIPRRLLAFERLLQRRPELRGQVRLVQVAAPSRIEMRTYASFKRQVDELVGRINGTYGTAQDVPIHYVHRMLGRRQIVPLYLAADVMLVTPLRDGMNLVAKEFVACRGDGGGVLVVSEFAGAAAELSEALGVNPYDLDGMADAMGRALDMPPEERAARMAAMRARVRDGDVHRWVTGFLADLEECTSSQARRQWRIAPPQDLDAIATTLRAAPRLGLFADYDGTLVPLAALPHLASPDAELLDLLRRLAARPGLELHLVSGRPRQDLDRWFPDLDAALHAEHGLWSLDRHSREWRRRGPGPSDWRDKVRPLLAQFVKVTSGSFIEEKSEGLAWHWRGADPEFGSVQAKELRLLLVELLSNVPVTVLAGDRVVEVLPQGVDKGAVLRRALVAGPPFDAVLAIGDDRTDEHLFAALPPGGIAMRVGLGPSRASIRLRDPRAVRAFLALLVRR